MSMTGTDVRGVVRRAREAVEVLDTLGSADRSGLVEALADALISRTPDLLAANERDVERSRAAGQRAALIDRLRLTPARIRNIADGVRQVARLDEGIGSIEDLASRPNGMLVGRMRVPIGVILMIYEARPNVTADAAALCLKSANAVILRGGSEARETNAALASVFEETGMPIGAVQVVADPDRRLVLDLLHAEGIDLAIPRGSEALIRLVAEHARMPVLKHFKGVCHLFVDAAADPAMALRVTLDAKTQRPSTCNALETLLVDRAIASTWLPGAVRALMDARVEVRGCPETQRLCPGVVPATDEDWAAEYLDLVLAVRVVDGFAEAVAHIRRYSTGLAEGIVTEHHARAMQFLRAVDSAAVLVNASTRLVDGAVFGLGAEIGISTDRLGPRGPMGIRELTTTKWVVLGSGQLRGSP